MKNHYSEEVIELIECAMCHNKTLIVKAGKFRGNLYCNPCYMIRIERQINEWKSDFKHFRNGKIGMLSKTEIMEAPSLSEYIN